MVSLPALVVPIVVAAVFVFIVSSVLHMALTYHRKDYRQLPDEAGLMEALRRSAPEPGYYFFPYCPSHKDMKTPEMQERFQRGPIGMLTVRPNGMPKLGGYLAQWFAFSLLIGLFCAYLAGRTLPPGTHYLQVFRVVGTAAFLGYGLGQIMDSIWKGMPWSNTARGVLDGLIYALTTAGVFGWLWPK
jgi:hypothetical protein